MRPCLALPFNAIRTHATAALAEAKALNQSAAPSPFEDDPVNWGDLRVVSAEYWEDDGGCVGWRVYVSEAGPGATRLAAFIHEHLKAQGLPDVYAIMEW